MVDFLERWQEHTNGTLLFYKCRLSVADTQRWWGQPNLTCWILNLNFFHSDAVVIQKHLSHTLIPLCSEVIEKPYILTLESVKGRDLGVVGQ